MVLLLDSWQVEGDEQSGMDCDLGKERPRVHQCRGHQHQGSTAMQMLVCLLVGCVYRKQLKVKGKALSRVRFFATPWTAAHQAPPSVGFFRQEHWSGGPLEAAEEEPKWKILKGRRQS